ncbi:MAG TPA: hypothetical protein VK832_05810 [Burkholderiaceae bacterium]|nr:hypothetical protein [Burkholderiaceae bacterium]
MQNVVGFLQDGNGNLSATRLAFLLWAIGVFGVWAWVSIHTNTLMPIDPSVQTILGVLMTGKVVQSFSANDGPTDKVTLTVTPPPAPPAQ